MLLSARIYSRRVGRIVGGAVAAIGVTAVFLAALVPRAYRGESEFHGVLTVAFFSCWLLAAGA